MIRIIVIISLSIIAIFLFTKSVKTNDSISKNPPSETPTTTPKSTENEKNRLEIEYNKNKYQISWFVVSDPQNLFLHPNFTEKLSSSERKKNLSCKNLINAGFYDKSNKPLGLFISERKIVEKEIESLLFNGIFYLSNENIPHIIETVSDGNIRLAVQSGPVIYEKGVPRTLQIIDDKAARRMAVGITSDEKIIFLTFFNKESPLQGPYLQDLPAFIALFNNSGNHKIVSALNLDGGTASAFLTDNLSLNEVANIGSFFCEN